MAAYKQKTRIQVRVETVNEEGEKILAHIRDQIRRARLEKDFSTRWLSQQVNRSSSFLSKVEAGNAEPSILDLVALTVTLQKPLKYFVPTYYKERDEELTGEEWELVQHFRRIKSRETRKIAINTMQQLAEIE